MTFFEMLNDIKRQNDEEIKNTSLLRDEHFEIVKYLRNNYPLSILKGDNSIINRIIELEEKMGDKITLDMIKKSLSNYYVRPINACHNLENYIIYYTTIDDLSEWHSPLLTFYENTEDDI